MALNDYLFSFSIVLQEIVTRSEPFGTIKMVGTDGNTSVISLDPQLIIQQLKAEDDIPFRPHLEPNEMTPELYELIVQCWDEIPTNRPSFTSIRQSLKKITKSDI